MVTLFRFLIKHHFVILFIIMESVAISLFVNQNTYQNATVNLLAINLNGQVATRLHQIKQYFYLKEKNTFLAQENERLRNQLALLNEKMNRVMLKDSADSQYCYLAARVINNCISKPYNYLMLNKGARDGILPEMAVISADGIVGVVHQVSEHFSQVISLLNLKLKASCKLKKNQYFGSLEWTGRNARECALRNIPFHVEVMPGDTVVTTGYGIFPEGIPVGHVDKVEKKGDNFYAITVKLFNDFQKLNDVYVVKDRYAKEKKMLEKQVVH